MRVAITGGTGFIGTALRKRLRSVGHEPTIISRSDRGADAIRWDPTAGRLDPDALADHDAVVHLAGESILGVRWTEEKKRRIHTSRTLGTDLVARTLAELAGRGDGPRTLVSVSGINYYGDRGDEVLTEDASSGEGFLAQVCRDWEAATQPAAEAGVRVVIVRVGIVQSREGGALRAQLPLFRLGLGGPVGPGTQYTSWISLEDLVGILVHGLETPDVSGPLNGTGPEPVPQAEYAATLGRVLGRPAVLPVPAFAPKLALGQMADELLLASLRVVPERTTASGYTFRHPTLETALRGVLDRNAA